MRQLVNMRWKEQVEIVRTAYEYQYMLSSFNNDMNRLKSAARTF